MKYFTTTNDIAQYVDECLRTSEGYPHDYDMVAIADELHELAGLDDQRQAFTENWDDEIFWAVVMRHDHTRQD